MDLTQKNFKELFIVKDVAVGGDTMDAMNIGEVGLFTPTGKRIVASGAGGNEILASAVDKARFVKKIAEGKFQISDTLKKSEIKKVSAGEYKPRTEQVTYIGFNGTDGALEVINDNQYIGRFVFDNLLVSNYSGDYYKHIQYKSPTSGTTQAKIAEGLVKSAIFNFEREEDNLVQVEIAAATTNDGALGTVVGDVTFTKGTKVISATDIDDATTNAALAVGDYVRAGANASDPVYRIVSIDTTANTATLNVPHQGATVTVANANVKVIRSADVADTDLGLKVTGQPLSSSVGRFLPSIVSFEMTLQNFGDTSVTYDTGANIGSNTAEAIAAEEFFYQGNQGDTFRFNRLAFEPKSEAENIPYNSIEVLFADEEISGSLNVYSPNTVKVAFPDGASNNVWSKAADGLQAVVNAYFGTSFSIS